MLCAELTLSVMGTQVTLMKMTTKITCIDPPRLAEALRHVPYASFRQLCGSPHRLESLRYALIQYPRLLSESLSALSRALRVDGKHYY